MTKKPDPKPGARPFGAETQAGAEGTPEPAPEAERLPRGEEARFGTGTPPREPPTIDGGVPPPENPGPAAAPGARGGRDPLGAVSLAGVVLLAVALGWLWSHPPAPAGLASQEQQVGALAQQVHGMAAQMQATGAREQAVSGQARELAQRLAAVEAQQQKAPAAVQPLEQRLAALEKQAQAQEKQMQADEKQVQAASAQAGKTATGSDVAALQKDVASIGQTQHALGQTQQGLQSAQQNLQSELQSLGRQVGALAQDQQGLGQHMAALGQAQRAQAGNLGAIGSRLDAVTQAVSGLNNDIGNVAKGLTALSQRAADAQVLTQRLDDVAHRQQDESDQVGRRLAALQQEIASLQQSSKQVSALAKQTQLASAVQAARAALDAGRPLGQIQGAPPALTRFATEAPPTEAALRLSFAKAAQAAEAAAAPQAGGKESLADRWWSRATQSFSVRQGDSVLVGNPVTEVLAQAQRNLDAGDLAGAVKLVSQLQGKPAEAMAPWLTQARGLLDARAALAQMAGQA